MDDAQRRFAELVEAFGERPGVRPPDPSSRRFGGSALTVDGRIFAMLVRDRLVVKLPRQRVGELIGTGAGEPFEAGGRPMKEWVGFPPRSPVDWTALAVEALHHVRG